VARTPRLSPRFLAQRRTIGIVQGSTASRALAATISDACNAPALPEPGDRTTLLDPNAQGVSLLVHVRVARTCGFGTATRAVSPISRLPRPSGVVDKGP
jgi:hypothetical protein